MRLDNWGNATRLTLFVECLFDSNSLSWGMSQMRIEIRQEKSMYGLGFPAGKAGGVGERWNRGGT